jgi:hypothetical protein
MKISYYNNDIDESNKSKLIDICILCGFKSQLFRFKESFICKSCYYKT